MESPPVSQADDTTLLSTPGMGPEERLQVLVLDALRAEQDSPPADAYTPGTGNATADAAQQKPAIWHNVGLFLAIAIGAMAVGAACLQLIGGREQPADAPNRFARARPPTQSGPGSPEGSSSQPAAPALPDASQPPAPTAQLSPAPPSSAPVPVGRTSPRGAQTPAGQSTSPSPPAPSLPASGGQAGRVVAAPPAAVPRTADQSGSGRQAAAAPRPAESAVDTVRVTPDAATQGRPPAVVTRPPLATPARPADTGAAPAITATILPPPVVTPPASFPGTPPTASPLAAPAPLAAPPASDPARDLGRALPPRDVAPPADPSVAAAPGPDAGRPAMLIYYPFGSTLAGENARSLASRAGALVRGADFRAVATDDIRTRSELPKVAVIMFSEERNHPAARTIGDLLANLGYTWRIQNVAGAQRQRDTIEIWLPTK